MIKHLKPHSKYKIFYHHIIDKIKNIFIKKIKSYWIGPDGKIWVERQQMDDHSYFLRGKRDSEQASLVQCNHSFFIFCPSNQNGTDETIKINNK